MCDIIGRFSRPPKEIMAFKIFKRDSRGRLYSPLNSGGPVSGPFHCGVWIEDKAPSRRGTVHGFHAYFRKEDAEYSAFGSRVVRPVRMRRFKFEDGVILAREMFIPRKRTDRKKKV